MNNNKNINTNTEDLKKLIPTARELKTLSGEVIQLPIITLGLELKVMNLFFEFLKSGGYQDSDLKNQGLQNILLESFCNDTGNKLILEMLSVIVGKPSPWVLNNVDITALAECLLPFFVTRIQALTKAIGSLGMVRMDMQS